MPIPLLFAIVPEAKELFVNGGVLENYPVRLFDRAKYFAKQNRPRHITTPQKPTPRLSGRRLKTSSTRPGALPDPGQPPPGERRQASHRIHQHTRCGHNKFDLDYEPKRDLEASGRAGTEKYFNWYDTNAPDNRAPD